MKTLLFTFCIVLICTSNSFSQKRGIPQKETLLLKDKPGKPVSGSYKPEMIFPDSKIPVQHTASYYEKNLLRKIKETRISGNKYELKNLQKEYNNMKGVVTKKGESIGYIKEGTGMIEKGDNINSVPISLTNDIYSIQTVTEQRGNNTGRIWVIASNNVFSALTYSEIYFYYSDDNGINWFNYAYAYNPYETCLKDALDAEIIEDFSGTKYLFVAYGANTISSSKNICNLLTLEISGVAIGSVQRLEWPGFDYNDTDVQYNKPRITSDNEFWTSGAYLYIAVCQDSSDGSQNIFGEKVALITFTNTSTPSVDYRSEIYFYYSFNNPFYQGNCDIAWFDDPLNGGGSVILVESGAFFTTAIYMYETPDVGYLGLPTYEGYLDPDGISKSSACIASNGLYQNLMIVNVSEFDSSDYDIQYFYTTNAGAVWTDGFVNYTSSHDRRADIAPFRSQPGDFVTGFSDDNPFYNNVYYSTSRNNSWSLPVSPVNTLDASLNAFPRPGFALGNPDSCFIAWSLYSNSGVYASNGCSGILNSAVVLEGALIIEGFHVSGTTDMNRADTLKMTFRESVSPYNIVESRKNIFLSNGYFLFNFSDIDNSTDYYLVVNHRNSIETWSALPVNFTGGYNYYFPLAYSDTNAYGSNQKLVYTDIFLNNYYAIYSGDTNQDGVVDASDAGTVDNDAANFVVGYLQTDVNGDDVVDASDAALVDNNAASFVAMVTP